MAVNTYRWKPDTCGCVVIETHDDVAHTWNGVPEKKCLDHATVADSELYGVLHANPDGENRRKNEIHGHLLHDHDDLSELVGEGENSHRVFKSGMDMAWHYEGTGKNRVLHVTIVGTPINADHRKKFKDFTEAKHGPGRVVLR